MAISSPFQVRGVWVDVFISWSGERAHKLALALTEWLPDVIQNVSTWVSSENIGMGHRWGVEIGRQLEATSHGLICVTPESMSSPWLLFETGALAKSMNESRVTPVLLGVEPHHLVGPLALFQAARARVREEMFKVADAVNGDVPSPLPDERLRRAFDRAWGDLERRLSIIEAEETPDIPIDRPDHEMIAEVLTTVREVERALRKRTSRSSFGVLRADKTVSEDGPALFKIEASRDTMAENVLAEIDGRICTCVSFDPETMMATFDFGDGEDPRLYEVEYYPIYVFIS